MFTKEFRHIPVMLGEVLSALEPQDGSIYVDGTFGAGGYSKGLLEAADCQVYAIDRDPDAIRNGKSLLATFRGRLALVHGCFAEMEALLGQFGIHAVNGVALDIGLSSMQVDEAARGFSFSKDGPLDMRMSQVGPTAADVVNSLAPEDLSRVIAVLGEEHKARAIARAIVRAREEQRLETTFGLVNAIERATGKQKHFERTHPATRTFQALRIYVNGELDELAHGLAAAERLLKPGGRLAVVTFHSLEDRIVKRFLQEREREKPALSRHVPETTEQVPVPSFRPLFKGHREATGEEARGNPRARSAKLRAAMRTEAAAHPLDMEMLGVPQIRTARH
jgi:16S rRNA (cytosine1402-N4)-methyltransferase